MFQVTTRVCRLVYHTYCRLHRLQAQRHYERHLLHSTWSALLGYIVSVRTTRIRREHRLSSAASSHYAHQLLRRHWKVLKLHHSELKTKLKKLHHHYSSRYCRAGYIYHLSPLARSQLSTGLAHTIRHLQGEKLEKAIPWVEDRLRTRCPSGSAQVPQHHHPSRR